MIIPVEVIVIIAMMCAGGIGYLIYYLVTKPHTHPTKKPSKPAIKTTPPATKTTPPKITTPPPTCSPTCDTKNGVCTNTGCACKNTCAPTTQTCNKYGKCVTPTCSPTCASSGVCTIYNTCLCNPTCAPHTHICNKHGTCITPTCSPTCDPNNGVCTTKGCACNPTCAPTTQTCNKYGTCVTPTCSPTCNPTTGVCTDKGCACKPTCAPTTHACNVYGTCVTPTCSPTCDPNNGVCTIYNTCLCKPTCTPKTQICNVYGTCVTPTCKPACAGGVCTNTGCVCSPTCSSGSVCVNGACKLSSCTYPTITYNKQTGPYDPRQANDILRQAWYDNKGSADIVKHDSQNWVDVTFFGDSESPWPGTGGTNVCVPNGYFVNNHFSKQTTSPSDGITKGYRKDSFSLMGAAIPYSAMCVYGGRTNWLKAMELSFAGLFNEPEQRDLCNAIYDKGVTGASLPPGKMAKCIENVKYPCFLLNTQKVVETKPTGPSCPNYQLYQRSGFWLPTPTPQGCDLKETYAAVPATTTVTPFMKQYTCSFPNPVAVDDAYFANYNFKGVTKT